MAPISRRITTFFTTKPNGIKKPNIYTNTRRSATEHVEERVCKICKGNHHNGHCDQVAKNTEQWTIVANDKRDSS